MPIVEVACVKDYPGAWAEYRVHEGGYTQLVRRITSPGRHGVDREDPPHVRGAVPRLRARAARRPLLHPSLLADDHMPALEGLRVIDMATVFAGPGAARHLADFGADVIKVEAPGGDGVRRMGWFPPEGGDSYMWKLLGRGQARDRARPEDRRRARSSARARRRRRRAGRELPAGHARAARTRPGGAARAQPRPRDPARHRVRAGRSVRAPSRLRDDGRGDERVRGDQRRARRPAAAPADRAHRRGRRARRRVRGRWSRCATAIGPARVRSSTSTCSSRCCR